VLAALTLAPAVAGAGDAAEANSSSTTNSANATNANGSSTAADPSPTPSLATGSVNVKALLNVLVTKGVLAPSEASAIRNAAPDMELQLLVQALARKGVLNAADVAAASTTTAAQPEASTDSATAMATPDPQQAAGNGASQAVAPVPPPPPGPTVVAAIAPLRVLPVDPPKKDGLNAAFKMGGVKMTPYGFLKATADFDSSSPNGDDFPFVGLFLGSTSILNTGPTQASEFHLKARSARIGANFEWPDLSPKIVLTGRVEGDFEGNFSEVDNRDVSSIRSNAYQLRLAYVRMDYNATENTDLYFEGGQDWTIFGSSALPNILETTFLGAYYGDIYERSPQFQFGMVQKLSSSHNFKISPTFALMMPSSGQIEKLGSLGLAGQIAQAEREGADSGRPEIEGRLAFQFQLDDAKGVAPAQVLWSGFRGWRTSIVTNSNGAVNECSATVTTGCVPVSLVNSYVAAYPNGFRDTSTMYGNQLAVQLPTRWFTLVASGYRGGDMRFFFGGQVNSYFTDTNGLSNPVTFTTVDGGPLAAAGGAVLATNGSGQIVVAPQRPVRSFGGFVNLGLPLSRWFDADPKGHNAGWQLYLDFGKDQVVHRDLINPGASGVLPLLMGKMAAVTLYYKLNPYCSFGFEQSIYATRLEPGVDYTIAGRLSNLWQDHRTEFGPIFTF
jgi:hypothetical protein